MKAEDIQKLEAGQFVQVRLSVHTVGKSGVIVRLEGISDTGILSGVERSAFISADAIVSAEPRPLIIGKRVAPSYSTWKAGELVAIRNGRAIVYSETYGVEHYPIEGVVRVDDPEPGAAPDPVPAGLEPPASPEAAAISADV